MTGNGVLSMGSSCFRVWVISIKLASRHRGLEPDAGWCSINPWGGVVGASVFVVGHTAVAASWPSLWVAGRNPLRWALLLWLWLFGDSCGTTSVNHGKVISIHLDGTVVMKTSPSAKVTSGSIATGVPVHSSPGGEVDQGLGDTPPWPNATEPMHRQWYVAVG